MKVYISGKIGEEVISDYTREKFEAAEEMLQSMGHEVFNPCNAAWQRVLKRGYENELFEKGGMKASTIPFYDYCLLRDMMALSAKDAIYFLPDWLDSPGAKAEHAFAIATKKKIFYAGDVSAGLF